MSPTFPFLFLAWFLVSLLLLLLFFYSSFWKPTKRFSQLWTVWLSLSSKDRVNSHRHESSQSEKASVLCCTLSCACNWQQCNCSVVSKMWYEANQNFVVHEVLLTRYNAIFAKQCNFLYDMLRVRTLLSFFSSWELVFRLTIWVKFTKTIWVKFKKWPREIFRKWKTMEISLLKGWQELARFFLFFLVRTRISTNDLSKIHQNDLSKIQKMTSRNISKMKNYGNFLAKRMARNTFQISPRMRISKKVKRIYEMILLEHARTSVKFPSETFKRENRKALMLTITKKSFESLFLANLSKFKFLTKITN